jgi:hypothetical protein
MPETRTALQPVRLDYTCDDCGQGQMHGTSMVLLSSPPQYPHRCDVCGAEKTFGGASYPRVEFVDVTDAEDHQYEQIPFDEWVRQWIGDPPAKGFAGEYAYRKPLRIRQPSEPEALTEADRNAVIALRATADAIERRMHTLSPHSTWEVIFGPNQRPDRFRCDLLFIGARS